MGILAYRVGQGADVERRISRHLDGVVVVDLWQIDMIGISIRIVWHRIFASGRHSEGKMVEVVVMIDHVFIGDQQSLCHIFTED